MTANEIKNKICEAKNIAIFGHLHPDLDCFGAMFGAKFLCENLGTKCDMFSNFSDDLFLLNIFPKTAFKEKFKEEKYDLILIVDCNSLARIDELYRDKLIGKRLLIIDHHEQNEQEENADFYIKPQKCSASIILFELLQKFNIQLTAEYATYLFSGLVGDTGRFLHTNTDASAFICASKLLKAGADIQKVYDVIYRSLTMEQARLRDFMFANLKDNGKRVCYLAVSEEDLVKLHASVEDLKMFVDDINKIKDYDVVMLAYEVKPKEFKVSLRSKNGVTVSNIANKYGGGGHKMAAGFNLIGDKYSITKKLKAICEEF